MQMTSIPRWAAVLAVGAMLCVQGQDAQSIATASAMARVVKKVSPEFPAAAKQLNVVGQSEVTIVVGTGGDVEDAKVLKGNAIFSQASLNAVKQWKFTPLTKDGAPVKFSAVIIFNYQK
jgi:TonB family protein